MIGEAVPAAPAIPAALLAALGLVALLGTLLALGMLKAWDETLGRMLRALADKIDVSILHTHPLRPVARALRGLDHQVRNGFGWLALKGEAASSWCFSTAGVIWHWMAREIADLAHDVGLALDRTVTSTLPKGLNDLLANVKQRLRGIDATLGKVDRIAAQALRRAQLGIDRIGHVTTKTIPNAVRGVAGRVGSLERTVPRLNRRVTALEKRWALPAVTAVVMTALARLGLRWLRCGNVNRVGKSVCKMDSNLLESLLIDAAALTIAFDLETFAKEVQAITSTVAGEIHRFAE